ncbi:MAG: sulfotransferase [Gammaproteobacteria bacterium]
MDIPDKFAPAEALLHEAASRMAGGLTDFGDPGYLAGLRVLLAAMDDDIDFSDFGRQYAFGDIVDSLAGRLYAEQGFKEHPAALTRPIRRPVIITGVPRTGTTALQKLMSLDPQFQGLEMWLTDAPMVRPPRDSWESYPQFQAMVARLKTYFDSMPEQKAAHLMVSDEVDECLRVMRQDFCSNHWGSSYPVADYDAWWLAQSEAPSYSRFYKVMQLIGADDDRTWLLKNPGHIYQLPLVMELFPDACIIQTHRHPARAIPSLCNLLLVLHSSLSRTPIDPSVDGRRELRVYSEYVRRAMKARESIPSSQVMDVDHRRFHQEPLAVIEEVYARFGLTLLPEVKRRMELWVNSDPLGKQGGYTLEKFGLSEALISEHFGEYIARFKL